MAKFPFPLLYTRARRYSVYTGNLRCIICKCWLAVEPFNIKDNEIIFDSDVDQEFFKHHSKCRVMFPFTYYNIYL